MKIFLWGASIVVICWSTFIEGMEQYEDKRNGVFTFVKGKRIKGFVIDQRTVTSPLQCSLYCTRNNLCMSFNYKLTGSVAGGLCELNNATRITSSHLYQDNPHYDYYFDPRSENFKSCLDYLRNGAKENGIYTITDSGGDSYQVFCDLKSEAASAWTLIQSYALKNRMEHVFCRGSFASNLPIQEILPNWQRYRSSLQRMKLLSDQSTHWRSTTGFEKYGVDYTDYVRGKISSMDILSSTVMHGACKTVEYVNIRGINGTNLQVNFYQEVNVFPLHTDSFATLCPFKPNLGAKPSENNFGFYCEGEGAMNPSFRGTTNEDSTTQWWFGGYL